MKFDIILHGKPNAGSHKATNGLEDSFCENLVDRFFQSMNNIKETETLIVDARNWKGKWYSVYTFWLGNSIKDTANRTSFIAISVVIPEQYVYLVSALYDLLKKACKAHIIGTYISNSGKYLVQDFNDDSSFERLYAFLNNNFVNLCENYDGSFKQAIQTPSCVSYNLIDCDSLAFVEDLKKNGRVFVSNTFDSKDSRLASTDKYFRELQTANSELSVKNQKIEQLSQTIKDLEAQMNSKNSNAGKMIETLKAQVEKLQNENNILKGNITQLKAVVEKYQKNEQEIQKLLSVNVVKQPKVETLPEEPVKPTFKVKNILPFLNTLLLLFLIFASCFKSCSSEVGGSTGNNVNSDTEELLAEVEELKEIIKEKDAQLNAYHSSAGGTGNLDVYYEDNNSRDKDCGLELWQNNRPLSSVNDIDESQELVIKVRNEEAGYDFYVSNLIDKTIKSGVPFKIRRRNKNKEIIISYRSPNVKNKNLKNVVTF